MTELSNQKENFKSYLKVDSFFEQSIMQPREQQLVYLTSAKSPIETVLLRRFNKFHLFFWNFSVSTRNHLNNKITRQCS